MIVIRAAHLREGVQGVDQLQLSVATQGDHLVHLLELEADRVEARHELIQPPLAQCLMRLPHLAAVHRTHFSNVSLSMDYIFPSHPLLLKCHQKSACSGSCTAPWSQHLLKIHHYQEHSLQTCPILQTYSNIRGKSGQLNISCPHM